MDIPDKPAARNQRRGATQLASKFPRIHPDVTQRRLAYLARCVLRVWRSVRVTHRPTRGDTLWGFGTRFHERMCHCLRRASQKLSWLRLIEQRLRFVFTIGAAPFRFYRGYAGRPRKNYLLRNKPETDQQALAGIDIDWCCRIAIDGGDSDVAPRVILVQHSASTGQVRNAWQVTPAGEAVPMPAESSRVARSGPLQPELFEESAMRREPQPAPMPPQPERSIAEEAIVDSPRLLARAPATQPRPTIRVKNKAEADEGS